MSTLRPQLQRAAGGCEAVLAAVESTPPTHLGSSLPESRNIRHKGAGFARYSAQRPSHRNRIGGESRWHHDRPLVLRMRG
ncbi:MAG: hypothetical protein GTO18_07925 [Anaerolineales bacterium]|nr:hypothetical protein [Anaerolineales bacterium]